MWYKKSAILTLWPVGEGRSEVWIRKSRGRGKPVSLRPFHYTVTSQASSNNKILIDNADSFILKLKKIPC
jgi:hypothetical protein